MEEITNTQKYENYKQQMGRLSRAMKAEFYYEAIFIAYAVLEDRTESVLRHAGVYNPDRHKDLSRKLHRIEELARQKKSLPNKYFSTEQLQQMKDWKEKRNSLIHALMKNTQNQEELKQIAEEGYTLCRMLSSKVTSFKRALEREAEQSSAEPMKKNMEE